MIITDLLTGSSQSEHIWRGRAAPDATHRLGLIPDQPAVNAAAAKAPGTGSGVAVGVDLRLTDGAEVAIRQIDGANREHDRQHDR